MSDPEHKLHHLLPNKISQIKKRDQMAQSIITFHVNLNDLNKAQLYICYRV
jgi:hypothetical protein